MELALLIFLTSLTTYWSAEVFASAVRDNVNKATRNTEYQRPRRKSPKNGTRINDAMTDILYENKQINRDIAMGKIEQFIVEGDILIHQSNSSRSRRTVSRRVGVKWPGGVVPYIVDTEFSDKEKKIIFGAMQRFHEESCIKFRKRTIEPDYLFVTPGKGCWSMVGRQGGMQKLSLLGTCKVRKGTIMHELMHCLGFRHEHNRPDRDKFIRIMWYNIEAGYSENFGRHTTSEVDTMRTVYDYFSIMHYPLSAFSANGQWTIHPLRLHHSYGAVGSRHDFSEQDVSRINQLYNCGACTDTDTLYCPVWAMRGECKRNIAWMVEHCPLSCDSCPQLRGSNRVYIQNCEDKNGQCDHWAKRGECTRNPSYMESHCQRSCNLCYYDVHVPPEREEVDDECADKNTLCPEWATLGECTRNPYMLSHCKESCRLCKKGGKNGRACTDNENSCAEWAREGLCRTHAAYMLKSCKKSCRVCTPGRRKTASTTATTKTKTRNKQGRVTNVILDETIHQEDNEDEETAMATYCTDLHSTCSQWAVNNECVTNPEWMAINCPNSCGLCGNSVQKSAACVDRHKNCTLWAKEGDCVEFPDWMMDKCPASCQFCSQKDAAEIPKTNMRLVKCKDKKKQCTNWATEGQCQEYEHWMTANCAKACDACDHMIDRSCVDKEKKCPNWATKKECRRNKGWFLPNCQFSCNACTEAVPICVDQHRSCRKKAKKGLCDKKTKIRNDCPYSCKLCGR